MSPVIWVPMNDTLRFPRVSGDEPNSLANLKTYARFSPRERG